MCPLKTTNTVSLHCTIYNVFYTVLIWFWMYALHLVIFANFHLPLLVIILGYIELIYPTFQIERDCQFDFDILLETAYWTFLVIGMNPTSCYKCHTWVV